jgi:hypothetical protein
MDRRRELDQRMRIDLPHLLQRRVQQLAFRRQIVRPLRHPPEQRPVDVAGIALGDGDALAFRAPGIAGAATGKRDCCEDQHQAGESDPSSKSAAHREACIDGLAAIFTAAGRQFEKRRTRIELASSAWKAEALPLSYRRIVREPSRLPADS